MLVREASEEGSDDGESREGEGMRGMSWRKRRKRKDQEESGPARMRTRNRRRNGSDWVSEDLWWFWFVFYCLVVPDGCIFWRFRGRRIPFTRRRVQHEELYSASAELVGFHGYVFLIGTLRTNDAMRGVWFSEMGYACISDIWWANCPPN